VKKILVSLALATSMFALEFRVGVGSYDTDFKIMNFADHKTTNDTTVFVISNPRADINENIFYYYDLEYFISDNKKQETKFGNPVANHQFPIIGEPSDKANDFIDWMSVYGDYEGLGFDINFGLGYDILKGEKGYLAIAINSGATLPKISAKNIRQKAEFAYDMINKWDLDIGTYKLGLALKRRYDFSKLLSLYATIGYGFQKAYIESDMFKSDIDSSGTYRNFDIGLKLNTDEINFANLPKNLFLTLGYSKKSWSVDSVDVNLFNYFKRDLMRPFDLDLDSSYTYFGVNYKF
jgi:hypothetical protein